QARSGRRAARTDGSGGGDGHARGAAEAPQCRARRRGSAQSRSGGSPSASAPRPERRCGCLAPRPRIRFLSPWESEGRGVSKKLIVSDGKSERELLLVANIVVGRDPLCDISGDDSLL